MLFKIAKHTDMRQSESTAPAERYPDGGPLCFCVLLRRCCYGRKQKAHSNAAKPNYYQSQHTASLVAKCALEFSLGDRPVLLGIKTLCLRLGQLSFRCSQR